MRASASWRHCPGTALSPPCDGALQTRHVEPSTAERGKDLRAQASAQQFPMTTGLTKILAVPGFKANVLSNLMNTLESQGGRGVSIFLSKPAVRVFSDFRPMRPTHRLSSRASLLERTSPHLCSLDMHRLGLHTADQSKIFLSLTLFCVKTSFLFWFQLSTIYSNTWKDFIFPSVTLSQYFLS